MAKFEENLDAKISEVLSEAKLSDEMYQKYMQFVGALDALPQDQISTDRFTSDIHDQFGRVRPMSSWPTKTSRAKSEKVWLNYNQRLQLAQAAKEGGTAPEDPTDDPDFLGQLLDTCVRTSMSMGKLDKQTAFRHCSRQVKRFETGIRTALADRGLTKAQVEEFTQQLLRGMANGKQIDVKDLSVEDRQFIQDLKDSLTYKAKNEGLIREDLDDRDAFARGCNYYGCDHRPDSEEFHKAHTTAFDAAVKSPARGKFSDALQREMAKFGYSLVHTGKPVDGGTPFDDRNYVKQVKESLEDSDEFEQCEYADCAIRHAHGDPKFHDAHTKAAAFADGVYAKDRNWSEFIRNFAAIMGRYGYSKDSSGKWGKISLGGGIKEDISHLGYKSGDWLEIGPKQQPQLPVAGLDDTDEFGGENEDWPTTPVLIQVIFSDSMFLSNHELLALPDKSGVRWHARPKWAEPKWFEQWSRRVSVWEFEKWVDEGLVRKIDNIQEWFHAQPEK